MGYVGNSPALDETVSSSQIVDLTIATADIAADAITNAKIADGQVDTEHLAASAVETAKINNDAVTLAKMAGGTDGNVISYDASGDPVAIATGSDGQVLTSTGAGSPPAFEAAGGVTSVEMFYPLYAEGFAAFRDSYLVGRQSQDDSEEVVCSGVAPSGFASISAMSMVFIGLCSACGTMSYEMAWSIAADDQSYTVHTQSTTDVSTLQFTATNLDAYKKSILNVTGSGDFEDVIAANDIFGIKMTNTSGNGQSPTGISIVWEF